MRRSLFAACLILLSVQPALAAPKVIASILPLHSIVSAVMQGIGEPDLLLKGALSEHRATFTPSQVAELGHADLVFIVGGGLEAKLAQLSGSEAVNGKRFVTLSDAPGVRTLPVRQGGAWEPDDHDHDGGAAEAGHAEGVLAFDPHVWLDPENAKAMAQAVAEALAAADTANAAAYRANAAAFAGATDRLSAELAAGLAPVKDRPFVVFHDAYQYFERRFSLAGVGSISDVSAHSPSAGRLAAIRAKLSETRARCVFREPQYDSRTVAAVIEGTDAREGVLDPLGATLKPGPDAYGALLRNLAASLEDCLSR